MRLHFFVYDLQMQNVSYVTWNHSRFSAKYKLLRSNVMCNELASVSFKAAVTVIREWTVFYGNSKNMWLKKIIIIIKIQKILDSTNQTDPESPTAFFKNTSAFFFFLQLENDGECEREKKHTWEVISVCLRENNVTATSSLFFSRERRRPTVLLWSAEQEGVKDPNGVCASVCQRCQHNLCRLSHVSAVSSPPFSTCR